MEPYPDADDDQTGMVPRRRRSIALLRRVLDEVVGHDGPYPPIDARSEAAFQLARTLRVDAASSVDFETGASTPLRLDQVDALLRAVLESGEPT